MSCWRPTSTGQWGRWSRRLRRSRGSQMTSDHSRLQRSSHAGAALLCRLLIPAVSAVACFVRRETCVRRLHHLERGHIYSSSRRACAHRSPPFGFARHFSHCHTGAYSSQPQLSAAGLTCISHKRARAVPDTHLTRAPLVVAKMRARGAHHLITTRDQ